MLGECQQHCSAQGRESLSVSVGNISGALAQSCAHAEKAGKMRSSGDPGGMSELLLVSKPIQAFLNCVVTWCYIEVLIFVISSEIQPHTSCSPNLSRSGQQRMRPLANIIEQSFSSHPIVFSTNITECSKTFL